VVILAEHDGTEVLASPLAVITEFHERITDTHVVDWWDISSERV
jgi:hypothetical protein